MARARCSFVAGFASLIALLPSLVSLAFAQPAPRESPSSDAGRVGPARERPPEFSDRVRERWLLSVEGVTHVPIDVGGQIGVETPFGLRVFAGYGLIPDLYVGALTGVAASASGDARARAVLDSAEYSGDTARIAVGVRPFPNLGFYVDAGYAYARLDGERAVPELARLGLATARGGYRATTALDLWLLEFGYQLQLGGRLVLAAGAGVTATIDSRTRILPVGGAPDDPLLYEGALRVDRSFERYGYVPTLTLRMGFDLI